MAKQTMWQQVFLVAFLVGCSMSLQGCSIAGHKVGAWESKANFMNNFQVLLPGQTRPVINSCKALAPVSSPATPRPGASSASFPPTPPPPIPPPPPPTATPGAEGSGAAASAPAPAPPKSVATCSGNGECKAWGTNTSVMPALYFCKCKTYWCDPECRTPRKSQTTAFTLALFGGFFGLDRFYLNEWAFALAKIGTLGGLGFWWLYDIVRIGSGPVYAHPCRLAADLSHPLYIVLMIILAVLLGLCCFRCLAAYVLASAKKAALLKKEEEEYALMSSGTVDLAADEIVEQRKIDYQYLIPYYGATHRNKAAENLWVEGDFRNYNYYQYQGGMHSRVHGRLPSTLTPYLPPWEQPENLNTRWAEFSPYVPAYYQQVQQEEAHRLQVETVHQQHLKDQSQRWKEEAAEEERQENARKERQAQGIDEEDFQRALRETENVDHSQA